MPYRASVIGNVLYAAFCSDNSDSHCHRDYSERYIFTSITKPFEARDTDNDQRSADCRMLDGQRRIFIGFVKQPGR